MILRAENWPQNRILPNRAMEHFSDTLRRRIALYRRYLREGVDAELAAEYLRVLREDETALAEIERRDKASGGTASG
jgi:hypothetical protein